MKIFLTLAPISALSLLHLSSLYLAVQSLQLSAPFFFPVHLFTFLLNSALHHSPIRPHFISTFPLFFPHLKETVSDDVEWIHLAQDRDQWRLL
jgi:hypothetical protein